MKPHYISIIFGTHLQMLALLKNDRWMEEVNLQKKTETELLTSPDSCSRHTL